MSCGMQPSSSKPKETHSHNLAIKLTELAVNTAGSFCVHIAMRAYRDG